MKLKELFEEGTAALEREGIENPSSDAFYLLEYVTGCDMKTYLLEKELPVSPEVKAEFEDAIRQRAAHIPCQYITGRAYFMGFEFAVTGDVLIPRQDTEVLCAEAIAAAPRGGRVLDLCTGSGCVAAALKKLRGDLTVTASDISQKALAVAEKNAKRIGADVQFVRSDLFEAFEENERAGAVFDCIVSNPPYVSDEEYAALPPEIKDREPALSLKGGPRGMDVFNKLVPGAARFLKPGGYLITEIGFAQAGEVRALFEKNGFGDIKVVKDLSGFDRAVRGRLNLKS